MKNKYGLYTLNLNPIVNNLTLGYSEEPKQREDRLYLISESDEEFYYIYENKSNNVFKLLLDDGLLKFHKENTLRTEYEAPTPPIYKISKKDILSNFDNYIDIYPHFIKEVKKIKLPHCWLGEF